MFLIDRLLFPFFLDKDEGGGDNKTEAGQGAGGQKGADTSAATVDEKIPPKAQALIDKLREKEKEYDKFLKAEEKRKRDELSETERLKAEKSDLEKQVADVQKSANLKLARASVIEAAASADFKNPSLVWKALKDDLTISADGEVEGLDKALAKLAKDEPYLLKQQPAGGEDGKKTGQTRQASPGNPGSGAGKLSKEDIAKMSPQEVAQRWFNADGTINREFQDAMKG